MKITKLGHCCLLIQEQGLHILTDPGAWTTAQNEIQNIDLILITHEHPDHLHMESLQTVLANNPQARIITNSGVGKILTQKNIHFELLEHGQETLFQSVRIEGYGSKHAYIYKTIPEVINTGYFISNCFFYPGDALYDPGKPVEILALPVSGTWLTLAQALDYAIRVRAKKCFPVHDGMLKFITPPRVRIKEALEEHSISFIVPEDVGNVVVDLL